jgi:hypothetical protein
VARIRTIKPEFFTSLSNADLSIPARLTFIGLWTHADDQGRCVDDARLIKAALWPLERSVKAIEADLDELDQGDKIQRYEVAGRRFLSVTEWLTHQRIRHRSRPTHGGISEDSRPESHDRLTEESVRTHDRKGTGKGTGKMERISGGARIHRHLGRRASAMDDRFAASLIGGGH